MPAERLCGGRGAAVRTELGRAGELLTAARAGVHRRVLRSALGTELRARLDLRVAVLARRHPGVRGSAGLGSGDRRRLWGGGGGRLGRRDRRGLRARLGPGLGRGYLAAATAEQAA